MYFKNCTTQQEAKDLYRTLLKENHPDKGGSTTLTAQIILEYKALLAKDFIHSAGKFYKEKGWSFDEFNVTPFVEILHKIIDFNIDIEIIGFWIYAFNSYEYKEQLKDLGFFFSKRHKAWIYSGSKKKLRGTGATTADNRYTHGSVNVKSREEQAKIAS